MISCLLQKDKCSLENAKLIAAEKFLFCDTNLLELVVYSRAYYDEL